MSIRPITAVAGLMALLASVACASAQGQPRPDGSRGRAYGTEAVRGARPARNGFEADARSGGQTPAWWPRETGVVVGKDPAQSSM